MAGSPSLMINVRIRRVIGPVCAHCSPPLCPSPGAGNPGAAGMTTGPRRRKTVAVVGARAGLQWQQDTRGPKPNAKVLELHAGRTQRHVAAAV